jgi:drug/metabolite transporter (DMT)-like permease
MVFEGFLGELAAIAGAISFGIGNVLIKSQSDKIKPFAINAIRLLLTAIIYFIILISTGLLKEAFSLGWRSSLFVIGGSLAGIVIGDLIFFFSQQLIGLSRAYPIAVSYPFFTYIIELLFFDEKFRWLRMLGVILVILGVYFISVSTKSPEQEPIAIRTDRDEVEDESGIIASDKKYTVTERNQTIDKTILELGDKNNFSEKNNSINDDKSFFQKCKEQLGFKKEIKNNKMFLLGLFLAIGTAICWTAGTLLMDRVLTTDINGIAINGLRMICIAPIAQVIFFSFNHGKNKSQFSLKGVLLVILAGLIGNTVGGLLYVYALTYTYASTTAAITAAAPLVATPLSIIFLKEKFNWILLIGTILTIAGIWLIILC